MAPKGWLVGLALAAVLAIPSSTSAGGPGVGIVKMRGTVQIKSLSPGGKWRPAQRGELYGQYTRCLLRTGPRSWVHLRDFNTPRSARGNVACVEANSVVRIYSNCGYRVELQQGRMSAIDGRRGKSLRRIASR